MAKKYQINLNLLHLSWPIFIERLSAGLVTFTDTLFLCMISDNVAASIGMLGSVLMFGYFILPQFAFAGTSVSAQYMGAKQDERVVPSYIGNLVISTILGGLITLAMFIFSGQIGLWLGMNPEQNSYATEYLAVVSFTFILAGARFAYSAILAARTLTSWNMSIAVVTNILNILFKLAFIKGFWLFPQMGIKGVALATLLSFAIGLIMLFYYVHIRLKISFLINNLWPRVKEIIPPILKIGIPSALEPFSYAIQSFVVAMLIIKLGLVAMGANTYIGRLIFIDLALSWSLTSAGQIIMSHHLGAGRLDKVNRTYLKIAAYSMAFAFGNILIYLIWHDWFLSLFTQDPLIKATAVWILVVCLFMEPIRSINILGGVALKTVGDGKFSAIMGIIFMWGVVPIIILASNLGTGIIGLWVCLLLDEILRAIINFWRWQSGVWKNRRVIGPNNSVPVEG